MISATEALTKLAACPSPKPKDVATYLEIRGLLTSDNPDDRARLERLFASFYGLNPFVAGVYKRRYFDILRSLRGAKLPSDPYSGVLRELYEVPRAKGDQALQCSFVSKLISIHDEARPIYDRHVGSFFSLPLPVRGTIESRIAEFVRALESIRQAYSSWSLLEGGVSLLKTLRSSIPDLERCHPNRVWDFLVWAHGNDQARRRRGRKS